MRSKSNLTTKMSYRKQNKTNLIPKLLSHEQYLTDQESIILKSLYHKRPLGKYHLKQLTLIHRKIKKCFLLERAKCQDATVFKVLRH